jgi:hypothetical protein
VDALARVEVNIADSRGAGLWRDSKDDINVAWGERPSGGGVEKVFPWSDRMLEDKYGE